MSLKKLKRRLSWTFRPGARQSSVDETLTELADQLTIKENGGIEENGSYMWYTAYRSSVLADLLIVAIDSLELSGWQAGARWTRILSFMPIITTCMLSHGLKWGMWVCDCFLLCICCDCIELSEWCNVLKALFAFVCSPRLCLHSRETCHLFPGRFQPCLASCTIMRVYVSFYDSYEYM